MKPVAKQGDTVTSTDAHIVVAPNGVAATVMLPFTGTIDNALEPSVLIEHKPAAVHASTATNTPAHVAVGGTFLVPPSNRATIVVASGTVLANHKLIARNGDSATTCNDPEDAPVGSVVASGTVLVG